MTPKKTPVFYPKIIIWLSKLMLLLLSSEVTLIFTKGDLRTGSE